MVACLAPRAAPTCRQPISQSAPPSRRPRPSGCSTAAACTSKSARDRRDDARKLLANDVDPGEQRKAIKAAKGDRAANSFEVIAREWFAKFSPSWAANHSSKILRRLERDIFPWIGARPMAEIAASELLSVLRRIEARGAIETAHRASQNCGQVFRYAVATGRAERDPTGDLRGALAPTRETHLASIVEPKAIGELLRAIDGYEGSLVTKCASSTWSRCPPRPSKSCAN